MKILNKTIKILKLKALLLCAALIFCCTNAYGQSITWERTYLRSNWTSGYSVKQTSDGNYIACGLRTNYGGFVLKLNPYGDTLWVRYFPVAEFTSVEESNEGDFIAVGWNGNVFITKINSLGTIIWEKQIVEINFDLKIWKINKSIDDNFLVVGDAIDNTSSNIKGYFLKINNDGQKIFSKFYDYENTNIILNDVIHLNNNLYIITGVHRFQNNSQVFLAKLDELGDTLWTKSFGTLYDERGYTVFQTNDNGFLSIGQINFGSAQARIYFSKLDSSGNLIWSRIYGDTLKTYEIISSDCAVYNSYTSSLIITGRYVSGLSILDTTKLFIVSIDTSGNRIWEKLYYKDTADIEGASIDLCNDSGYIIAGDLLDPPFDYNLTSPQFLYVIKTNKYGEIQPIGINNHNISFPKNYKLNPVYPNPFNPVTNITFEVPKASNIKINLYNILGKEVKILVNNTLKSGIYNLKLESGGLASGIYFVSMFADNNLINTQKIILIK